MYPENRAIIKRDKGLMFLGNICAILEIQAGPELSAKSTLFPAATTRLPAIPTLQVACVIACKIKIQ